MGGWKKAALAVGGLVILAAVAVGTYAWTPAGPPPDRTAIMAQAASYDVEIIRDRYGVPHIYGETDADAAFGLGYAQAEDDWPTVQTVLAATRGTLARYRGIEAAPASYLVDLLEIWDVVDDGYESGLSTEARAIAEAYADGLNLYAAENPGVVWAGMLPVTGKDIVAGFVFRTPFFYGLDRTLGRIASGEIEGGVDLSSEDHAFEWRETARAPRGSNAVAIAPQRSADGATRLLVNSHQPFAGPVAWYQFRLHSNEGLDVMGGTFPGAPIMLLGHNMHLGWASTVNRPDVTDVYRLQLNPENEEQYWFDGAWRDFDAGKARFRVRLFGPFSWPITRKTLHSVHGPVLRVGDSAFAVRYAGMYEVRHLEQFYLMNRATNFEEWAAAMRINAMPSINYIYGDEDGNIAYLYNAQMPDRTEGYDWTGTLPGDDPGALWQEFVPLDALPMVVNPRSGYLINSNNSPFRATDPADDADPALYPATFGLETRMTNRSLRALALFGSDLSITDEDLLAYKFDHGYDRASLVGRTIASAIALDPGGDTLITEAQSILRSWNHLADQENRATALALMTAAPAVAADIYGNSEPDVRESLSGAAAQLQDAYGRLDPTWGEVNRLIRGEVNLPVAGGPDAMRAIWSSNQLDENGQLTAIAGDTLIIVAEWNAEGELRSRAVHQFGAATLDEASPHYADQVEPFANEELLEVPLEEDAVRAEAVRIYRPGAAD